MKQRHHRHHYHHHKKYDEVPSSHTCKLEEESERKELVRLQERERKEKGRIGTRKEEEKAKGEVRESYNEMERERERKRKWFDVLNFNALPVPMLRLVIPQTDLSVGVLAFRVRYP